MRIHSHLRRLGLEIPTEAEENSDLERTLQLYASAVDELRNLTRDSKRFPLVFQGNVEYGYRRNLLGMKRIAMSVALPSLAAAGWSVWNGWTTLGVLAPVSTVAVLLIAGIILGWILYVSPDTVRLSADRYARFLFEATHDLEAK